MSYANLTPTPTPTPPRVSARSSLDMVRLSVIVYSVLKLIAGPENIRVLRQPPGSREDADAE